MSIQTRPSPAASQTFIEGCHPYRCDRDISMRGVEIGIGLAAEWGRRLSGIAARVTGRGSGCHLASAAPPVMEPARRLSWSAARRDDSLVVSRAGRGATALVQRRGSSRRVHADDRPARRTASSVGM